MVLHPFSFLPLFSDQSTSQRWRASDALNGGCAGEWLGAERCGIHLLRFSKNATSNLLSHPTPPNRRIYRVNDGKRRGSTSCRWSTDSPYNNVIYEPGPSPRLMLNNETTNLFRLVASSNLSRSLLSLLLRVLCSAIPGVYIHTSCSLCECTIVSCRRPSSIPLFFP